MRVELYSTLLISESTNFIEKEKDSSDIKSGIVEYSNKDKIPALVASEIPQYISDWQDILYDKCLENELTDMHVENATTKDFENTFTDEEKNKNLFIYANYLIPGLHKFIIYCPTSKRAFCKTILVDINTKEFYPEYPTQLKVPRKKLILNVWRHSQNENHDFD